MSEETPSIGGVTRLSFIRSSTVVVGGAAAIGVPATVVLAGESPRVLTDPSAGPKSDAVMAYVRDAERGEVTVVAGGGELTYRDPALVKRLLAAAPRLSNSNSNGGDDVIAS
jgi:hypothetical protein